MKHVALKKRRPFFAKLPKATIDEINRRSQATEPETPQWLVVATAFERKKSKKSSTKIVTIRWKKNPKPQRSKK